MLPQKDAEEVPPRDLQARGFKQIEALPSWGLTELQWKGKPLKLSVKQDHSGVHLCLQTVEDICTVQFGPSQPWTDELL